MKRKLLFIVAMVSVAAASLLADETQQQRDARMAWWRDAKFGMFIHWGVYAVPAGRYHGQPVPGIGEWIMRNAEIPVAEYRGFARQFNPTNYNPRAWAALAKQAGMKYIVITAKHHDGFALFPSDVSDWDVADATPYHKDLITPLAKAARRDGLKFGTYYSQSQDWVNPGGAKARLKEGEAWDDAQKGSYDEYLKNIAAPQVREILTRIKPDILWWDTPVWMNPDRARPLHDLIALRPGLITNNRLGGGFRGDTETPEQRIPATGFPGRDWETCMTMNDTWGFKTDDQNWKSTETLIRNLVDIVSKGGNYLLNVGPTASGEIPAASVQRLKEIGAWMKVNGDAIYGTTASPFANLPWGRCTKKIGPRGGTLYLHVFDWPKDGRLVVPGLRNEVTRARLLATRANVPARSEGGDVVLTLPAAAPDPIASVVALTIKGPLTVEPAPARPATGGASAGGFNVRDFGATGDGHTLDSPAINRAIAACAAAGGGTVRIPAGRYLSGSIHLTNNLELRLDAGAVIVAAPQNLNAYDETEPWIGTAYQDGGHTYFHNSLIWGENLTNVFITGPGMIYGEGLVRGDGRQDRMSGFNNWQHPDAPRTNLPPERLGNKAIALKLCRNVILRDFTILKGGHFAVLATGCDGMTVDNVTMDTDRDGIDIDCCRNTTVANCRINSPFDDALCPKSSFALGSNVITENLTIVNCQVSGFEMGTLLDGTMKPSRVKNGRIKFGTEANGGFRNVTVANCTFRACRGLALEEVDGGIMENITINNLTMMDVAAYPIYITTGKRNRGPDVTGPSRARRILISNVIATGIEPMSGIQITGLPEQPIEGVRLENIRLVFNGGGTKEDAARVPPELGTTYPEPGRIGVLPSYGVFARHVRDLELANIRVSFENEDLRPAMACVDVDGLEIDNFKAQLAEGVPAARFQEVKRLTVRNSPVLDGVTP